MAYNIKAAWRYTVNNAKPPCYNNPSKPEALLLSPPNHPFHPRMSVVSFNSPWLTSLLSRILNARLKHLRIGFCNIYNVRIIGSLLNVVEVITVRCFLCIDFSIRVFQLLARVHISRSNIIYFISIQKIIFQNHRKKEFYAIYLQCFLKI